MPHTCNEIVCNEIVCNEIVIAVRASGSAPFYCGIICGKFLEEW
ncbi:hypothetical protein YPPY66_1688 [Yersinia pestis PY-66]|uniref:Uncharacterized protein n=1 Tax=Yersinia pestis PY-08 TaxID=992134 RepID=A0AB72ZPQ0_YERPE|nr:hypothetical protein YPPY03_1547 [Yersinia pestis PY-03]EIR09721.1 hypothetical protein YPPY06_1517 [Yersinia pestis PY-06]EIR21260.1 hypothetical protein YPPY08_1530 [Yersinia pestis PY-08]EIR35238.1 hypothetical protein YPPY10_1564 [Yersinia pestis PY-10]EIR52373.1 hypothetical protein YPPY14_1489 [Yersinia pestis PY-14]EIR80656.1 hypothetical protein YPPY32_1770 [Yersinia pestis PY-32]EIS07312.1 hypothetical protein YPPY46_1499 [Yersinia pestis PY-46]EIS07949.1 hypothetical protein YPP